jgi:hypothetical protein
MFENYKVMWKDRVRIICVSLLESLTEAHEIIDQLYTE